MKRTNSRKSGFTLLEVLISTSVIMIGVFGIAGAIALSEQLVKNSMRSDMAANCGRAALKTMITMNWVDELDGVNKGSTKYFNWDGDSQTGDLDRDREKEDFYCSDHLRQDNRDVDLEQSPPRYNTSLKGDYSWIGTVRRLENDYCEISAAVTSKRAVTASESAISATVTLEQNPYSDVLLAKITNSMSDENAEELKAGQFVYLLSTSSTSTDKAAPAHWYRMSSVYSYGGAIYLELRGPHWTGGTSGQIRTTGGVVAAYTQIVPIQMRGSSED